MLQLESRLSQPEVVFSSLQSPNLADHRFTGVSLKGTFLNQFTLLLDNQLQNHQPGYRVITPLQVDGLDKLVLIDRGWITKQSQVTEVDGQQQIHGYINSIASGIVLKPDRIHPGPGPYVIQSLSPKYLNQLLPMPAFDFVISDNSLKANFGISSHKHYGYAAQWFIFAILVAGYYVINIRRGKYLDA